MSQPGDPVQFLNRGSLLDERKEGREGWVARKRKKRKKVFECNSARASTSAAIARDRASEIAGAVIKVSRKTCELVRCHQLWSVVSRAEILRVIGGGGGEGIVLHAESACNRGDPLSGGFLLSGIKGIVLDWNRFEKKGNYFGRRRGMVIGSVAPMKRNSIEMASISSFRCIVNCDWN